MHVYVVESTDGVEDGAFCIFLAIVGALVVLCLFSL